MERPLRALAVATLLFPAAVAYSTFPELGARPNGMLYGPAASVVAITVTLLMSATSMLGLVLSAQRRQRPWAVAFLLLLLLSTYSPLLFDIVVQEQDLRVAPFTTFLANPYLSLLLHLAQQVLPATLLAIVALVYSARESRRTGAASVKSTGEHDQDLEDQQLEIERSRIDRPLNSA